MSSIDHLSYSSVSTYLMCPKSWFFNYVEKVPTPVSANLRFGTAVHNTVQAGIKCKAESGKEFDSQDYSQVFFFEFEPNKEDEVVSWGDSSYDEYADTAERIFTDPEILASLNSLDPLIDEEGVAIERKVELFVPEVPVPVIGYIDLITADGVPMDFKTSSSKWYQNKADAELQPTFYLAALSQQNRHRITDGMFRYGILTKTKKPVYQELTTHRTAGDLFFMFDVVKSVWEATERKAFPENPTTWKCSPKWCEYWDLCRGKYDKLP